MAPWPYPFWFAHRGAGRAAPENTLAAFRLGASLGWRAFECDVKLSRDGTLFLLHDDTLDRTTNGRGPAQALSWPQLSALDAGSWHGSACVGEPLPRFEDIAHFVLLHQLALNAEIKPCPGRARETGEAVGQRAAALWHGHVLPPLLSSFEPEALVGARHAAPTLPRALLLDGWREGWLDEALALGCVAVVAHHPLWNVELVERVHGCGLKALTYTVNTESELSRLRAAHIDGVITDEVRRFSRHLPPTADGSAAAPAFR